MRPTADRPIAASCDRLICLGIFAALTALYVSTSLGRFESYDGEMMFRVAESIVDRGSFRITDEIFHASEPYSVFGLGMSLLFVPSIFLAHAFGVEPRFLAAFTNPIVTAATGTIAYAFGRLLDGTHRRALILALLFGIATIAWPYAKSVFSEPLIGCLIPLAAYFVVRSRYGSNRQLWWLAAAGIALGYAILTREDTAATIPLLLLYVGYIGWTRDRAGASEGVAQNRLNRALWDIGIFLLGLAPFLLATLAYHAFRFGSLVSGVLEKTGNTFLTDPAVVALGVFGLTLGTGKGLVYFSPLTLGGIATLPAFAHRHRAEAILIAALVVERVLLFGAFSRWFGGWGWGPRYLVPLGLLLLLPLVAPVMSRWRYALPIAGLAVLGVVVQIAAVSVLYVDHLTFALDERAFAWDEILFAPYASPIAGHLELLLAGRGSGVLLPLPEGLAALLGRLAIAATGLTGLGLAIARSLQLDRVTRR